MITLTNPPMPQPVEHSEIQVVAELLLQIYRRQHLYLTSKDDAYLQELQHRCEDLRSAPSFSIRVGAEVNLAAATMVLQRRSAAIATSEVQS